MSEFEDLEGPRRNNREIHLVEGKNSRIIALTSRVEARNLKKKRNYKTTHSVEVEDGEAHIGDKIWVVYSRTGKPKSAYHNEDTARNKANGDEMITGNPIKSWDVTTENLYTKDDLEERREKGFI